MKVTHILLFHNMAALKIRIEKSLKSMNILISEAREEKIYLEMLKEADNGYSLIIIDHHKSHEETMGLILKTRQMIKETPIIILTDAIKERFYFEAILKGATDFIIKPFSDLILIDKVSKHLNTDGMNMLEFVTMDLPKYIRGELRKAEKGNFPISLMLLNFEDKTEGSRMDKNLSDVFFNSLNDLFWDTDIFLKFASKYHLGVFPFCNIDSTAVVLKKIQNRFTMMKDVHREMRNFELVTAFTTYPEDSEDTGMIFKLLVDRMTDQNMS